MSPEQQAAFIMAQAACAMAEIAGMQAENQRAQITGGGFVGGEPPFRASDFDGIAVRYGIHHNAVISFFQG
jgi:hypothetical protein